MFPVTQSRQNPRVKALRAALAARRQEEIVAVESLHLLREALLSREVEVLTVYAREDRAELLEDLPADVEGVLLSHDAFASVAATEQSQGVAALVRRPELRYLPRPGQLLLVLAGVQDPGNVGTLLRSAEAFGASAVLVTEGTADVWNGKALRASAGAAFRLPVVRWTGTLRRALQANDVRVLASVAGEAGATAAVDTHLSGGCALVVGNEGQGVPAELLAECDGLLTLPMLGATESLNAAVAGSVLLYEAARQRAAAAQVSVAKV